MEHHGFPTWQGLGISHPGSEPAPDLSRGSGQDGRPRGGGILAEIAANSGVLGIEVEGRAWGAEKYNSRDL
ncbi:MAG: hypothetical protein ACLP2U_12170 [Syntrophobacteraceae bacterium]